MKGKVMELEFKLYRAAMVEKRYQAQIRCPACSGWILTTDLEAYKNEQGVRYADATDVQCQQTGCGETIENVTFKDWPYSAPVTFRRTLKREVEVVEG